MFKWGVKHNIVFLIVIALSSLYANIKTFNEVPLLLPRWIEILGYLVTIGIIWSYKNYLKEEKLRKACFCLLIGFIFSGIKRLIGTSLFITRLLSAVGIFFSIIAIMFVIFFKKS